MIVRDQSVKRDRPHLLGSLIVLALVLGACGGGAADPSAGPSSRPTTDFPAAVTTSTVLPEEAAVVSAYREFWEAYLEAADPMDPENPVLAEHAVNPQLERLQRGFLSRRSSGEVIRGTLDLAPEVVSIDGGTAVVSDCYADSTGVYDAETGERKDTPTGVRHDITAEMVLDGASWKVSDITREGDECAPS